VLTEPDQRDGPDRGSGKPHAVAAIVIESLPRATYRLKLETEQEVIAHLAGATVTNFVRLRPGDRVEVEVSPVDRTRGRITKLLKD
jgi:translation initiation factor IF-1